MRPDLSVVVPTYNECNRIEHLVEQILESCAAHAITAEVIVVDDNSPDGTGERADRLARGAAVRVIHRPSKLGLGSAVRDGFAAASGEIVGVIDADLSHPPRLVPVLYAVLKQRDVDVVVASRYVVGGGTKAWPLGRIAMSRMGCLMARPLTPVRDAMSGFFVTRRAFALGARTSARGFKIGLELLVKSRARSVAEIGYVFVGRDAGGSKMTFREALRFLGQLASLYRLTYFGPGRRPRHQVVAVDLAATILRETRAGAGA